MKYLIFMTVSLIVSGLLRVLKVLNSGSYRTVSWLYMFPECSGEPLKG